MANTVSILSYANTFGDWMVTTNAVVKENNDLAANNYTKTTGTLYLNDPTLGLQVGNNAVVAGQLAVQGVGSSAYVQNNLRVDGQIYFSNTTLGLYNAGQANIGGALLANGAGNGLQVANNTVMNGKLTVNGTTVISNTVTISGQTTINNGLLTTGNNQLQSSVYIDGRTRIANTLFVETGINTPNKVYADYVQGNSSIFTVIATASDRVYTDRVQANSSVNTATSTAYTSNATNLNVTGRGTINNVIANTVNTTDLFSTNGTVGLFNSTTINVNKVNAANVNATVGYVNTLTTVQGNIDTLQSVNIGAAIINATGNVFSNAIYANNTIEARTANVYLGNVLTEGTLTVSGNFVVTGTTINSSNTIQLSTGISVAANAALTVDRGITGANAALRWNEVDDYFDILDVNNSNYYRIVTNQHISNTLTSTSSSTVASSRAANTLNNSVLDLYGISTQQNTNIGSSSTYANGAFTQANAGYTQANTGTTNALAASTYANASFIKANSAYESQNVTGTYANSAYLTGNSSFIRANSAYTSQNVTGTYANAAFAVANTADYTSTSGSLYANGAFTVANTALNTATSGSLYANGAFISSNTAITNAAAASSYANAAFAVANTSAAGAAVSGGVYANGAFIAANTADGKAVTSGSYANSSFAAANSASVNAISAGSYANSAFTKANTVPTSTYIGNTSVSLTRPSGNLTVVGVNTDGYATYIQHAPTAANFPLNVGYVNSAANTVVRTDNQGYIQAGYFSSSVGGAEKNTSQPSYLWGTNSGTDTFMRTYNPANFTAGYATNVSGGTTGQLVYQSGAGATGFLATGTSGYLLQSQGAAAPAWVSLSTLSIGTATNLSGGAAGNLVYQSGAGTTAFLSAGTSGYVLQSGGTGVAPSWVATSGLTVGAVTNLAGGGANRIAYQTGAGATGFLAAGTSGYVLQSGGSAAAPSWVSSVSNATNATYATYDAGGFGIVNTSQTQTISGNKTFTGTTTLGSSGQYVNFNGIAQFTTASNGAAFGRATPNGNFAAWIQPNSTSAGVAGLVTQTYGNNTANMATLSTAVPVVYYWYGDYGGSPTAVGNISTNGSSTTYNTTSDYRLKENVVPLANAVSRLKQLAPKNFTWKNNPTLGVVEGFIAHEVQAVCPEAVHGVKDGVDELGNPKYQGMDPSTLVPLLTAALQEALARIEVLESKIK